MLQRMAMLLGLIRQLVWCSLLLVLSTGCLSTAQRVLRKTSDGDFAAASEILREGNPSPELHEARARFFREVERQLGRQADSLAELGQLEQAIGIAKEGLVYVPASIVLADRLDDLNTRLARIRDAEQQLNSADVGTPSGARAFGTAYEALGKDRRAARLLADKMEGARSTIRKELQAHLQGPAIDHKRLTSDAQFVGLGADPCLRAVAVLSVYAEDSIPFQAIGPCAAAAETGSETARVAQNWVDRWSRANLPALVDRQTASFVSVTQLERFRTGVLSAWPEFDCSLARLHARTAEQRAGLGLAAVLALLHESRARQLCGTATGLSEVRTRALATLSIDGKMLLQLTIEADPQVDPQLFSIVRSSLISALRIASRPHVDWRFASIGSTAVHDVVTLGRVQLEVPNSDQLETVRSTYFSHYEKVPNPAKQRLRYRLDSEKNDLESAESEVESAIRSYNISPSDYGLGRVNRASRNYASALDTYNATVDVYNSTPSTTNEPVFIPYSFSQGQVRNGWVIDFSFDLNGVRNRANASAVDRAFVRLGTNYADRRAEFRRDVPLGIETSVERMVKLLGNATNQVVQNVGPSLSRLIELPAGLEAEEVSTAQWLLHPWGPTPELAKLGNVPVWAAGVGASVRLPDRKVAPPRTRIAPIARKLPENSTEAWASWSSGLVGRIIQGSSIASGALISGDGLVLTCAHCIEGAGGRVRFSEASWAGEYPIEIVFVNSADDVALIRAVGLRTPKWFDVRLDDAGRKGEPVMAIGNMTVNSAVALEAGVTLGIVADPSVEYGSVRRLVADVAVASGSSGGPIVSLTDGKIIGVVTIVMQSGFFVDRAQSRTVCGAFPAVQLGPALGLAR